VYTAQYLRASERLFGNLGKRTNKKYAYSESFHFTSKKGIFARSLLKINRMSVAKKLAEQNHTFKEYLALEETAEFKSEFWDGTIVGLAGGTPTHGKIANNIGTAINNKLDKKKNNSCSAYNSDVKVYIPDFNRGVYPDCMVICGDEDFHKDSKAVITNPCLIIEVLSKSTKEYDSNGKFEGYRSIPSFKEYVLIWQTIPKVQSWYKEADNLWRISSAYGLDKTIQLYSINCKIALKDIYKRVKDLGSKDNPKAY